MVVDEGVRANGLVQDSMAELFSRDVKASSLLSVCKESRGNFLLKFPDTIETVEVGRVIRIKRHGEHNPVVGHGRNRLCRVGNCRSSCMLNFR